MNAIDRSATLIAYKELRFAGRRYQPGDKFETKRLSIVQTRKAKRLLDGHTRKLAELSAETMKSALKRREEGSRPPRGFTIAGLLALGILTQEQVEARGWDAPDAPAPEGDWTAPEGSWKVFAEGVDAERSTDDTTLWVVPQKSAGGTGVTRYIVHDLDGTNLSGDGSINGKANAEKWARDFMADRAKRLEQESTDPWAGFPENPDDWSDEQVEAFDAFYDDPSRDKEAEITHPAVKQLVAERDEAAEELKRREEGGAEPDQFEGLNDQEVQEVIEAMSDDEVRAWAAKVTGKPDEELAPLDRPALIELATEATKKQEAPDDSNVRPDAGGAEG